MLRDTQGTLAKFLGYFESNVAKAINREIGRGPTHFWQGHYDDQIVSGEKVFWNKYLYILTNAVKAGLVRRTEDWKGLNSFRAALTGKPIKGKGLNKTNFHNATRGNKKRKKSDYKESFEFSITPPPRLEEMTPKERKKEIYRMVKHAEVHYLSRRDTNAVLGMAKVLSFKPSYRPPKLAKRAKRKRFACDTIAEEIEKLKAYRAFIWEYKKTFDGFRRAAYLRFPFHGEWPKGSFPPSCHFPITQAV